MPKPKPTQAKPQMNYHVAIVVAVSAVALALLAAVIYIYNQDDLVNYNSTVSTTSANSVITSNSNYSNTNTGVITATSDWMTYTSATYSYTVKYPNGWTDENTDDANPAMFADPVAVAQTEETSLLQGSKIEIVVDQNVSTTLQAFASGQDREGDIMSEAGMTVAGAPGLWRAVDGPLGFYNVTYVKYAANIYRIIQYIPKVEDRGLYTAIYDQVLSSFKFSFAK